MRAVHYLLCVLHCSALSADMGTCERCALYLYSIFNKYNRSVGRNFSHLSSLAYTEWGNNSRLHLKCALYKAEGGMVTVNVRDSGGTLNSMHTTVILTLNKPGPLKGSVA